MSADVIQIFGAQPASDTRPPRPVAARARLAWARMRLVGGAARTVGGISEGDAVRVMVAPATWRTGVLHRWERGEASGSLVLATHTVGRVRLDAGQEPFRGQRDGPITAARTRITPIHPAH
jgi:hypothetical protein